MFEKNNPTIALNILCIKEKEICPAYISKINSNCEKQIILQALHCSKTIYIIKRNNIKASSSFLLLQLS